mmetsp:Transcript_57377/g.69043  ORF Transcript_57377/g.69043 Transcript_57377/m.69043 type:complete len:104 (+) Transcript_57377:102-413(+)
MPHDVSSKMQLLQALNVKDYNLALELARSLLKEDPSNHIMCRYIDVLTTEMDSEMSESEPESNSDQDSKSDQDFESDSDQDSESDQDSNSDSDQDSDSDTTTS